MNKQEIFNKAYLGLKAQNFERSVKDDRGLESCSYRGDNGLKCAIGHLLDDEDLKSGNDKKTYEGCFTGFKPEALAKLGFLKPHATSDAGWSKVDDDTYSFYSKLQQCHDYAFKPSEMERNLRDFAKAQGLTVPENE